MLQNKEIEREVYQSFHQDGLLDILTGIFILTLSISMSDQNFIPSFVLVSLMSMSITFFWGIKKSIVYPRLGYVSFSPERRAREKIKLVALITLWVVPLIVVIVIKRGFPPSRYAVWLNEHEVFYGQIFTPTFVSVGAVLSGVRRLYIYAVLTLLVFVATYLLNIPTHLYSIPLGIAVVISGTVVLIRFLRKYPKIAEEVSNGK